MENIYTVYRNTMQITETVNAAAQNALKPIKEKMDLFIPGITTENIPNRNGFISLYVGAPGSGKSSLLYSMLSNKHFYKKRFSDIFFICPEASYVSVKNHPLKSLDTKMHELAAGMLDEIYNDRAKLRILNDIEGNDTQYSLLVIDDFGSEMKQPDIVQSLKRIMVKSRHICMAIAITLQSYMQLDSSLRKLVSNVIMFKPSTELEWISLCNEHLPHLTKIERTQLHRYAYDKPYSHLDVDCKASEDNALARNFNKLTIKRS